MGIISSQEVAVKKVSVIVPVYNTEKYLVRCLESVLNQGCQDFEIICINDCSPDGCGQILSEYSQKYADKVRVITNEHNMKSGPSKDKALAMARGQYIIYLDSDDYLAQDYIARYVDAAEKYNADIVVGGYTKDIEGKFVSHFVTDSVWSITTYVIACSKMYRKEFIEKSSMKFGTNTCLEDMLFNLTGFFNKPVYHVMTDYADSGINKQLKWRQSPQNSIYLPF